MTDKLNAERRYLARAIEVASDRTGPDEMSFAQRENVRMAALTTIEEENWAPLPAPVELGEVAQEMRDYAETLEGDFPLDHTAETVCTFLRCWAKRLLDSAEGEA